MNHEQLRPFTKRQYDRIKRSAEDRGYTVVTKWRKGIKRNLTGSSDFRGGKIQCLNVAALGHARLVASISQQRLFARLNLLPGSSGIIAPLVKEKDWGIESKGE